MREIKFRGKRVDNGAWIYGFYYHSTINNRNYIADLVDTSAEEIIPETVNQYTGLKDKNGVEIFEGDMVKNLTEDIIQEIQYDIETARFVITGEGLLLDFDNTYSTELEVISNIYAEVI